MAGKQEAQKVKEEVVEDTLPEDSAPATDEMPVVDLFMNIGCHWSSHYSMKKFTVYLDVSEITLDTNQIAKLLQTPKGFVFERIDIIVLKPTTTDLALKFVFEDYDITAFNIKSESASVERQSVDGLQAGDYLPESWINLVNLNDKPQGEGRLAITCIGYLIEPWR